MTDPYEEMRRGQNPFVAERRNPWDDTLEPAYELKFGLVVYTSYPPGPKRARAVFDLYVARFGEGIKRWASTAPGEAELNGWEAGSLHLFRDYLLPELRAGIHWGYGFDDGREFDANLFMLHGYRPASEPCRAGFFRFEFPWNVSQAVVRDLAQEVIHAVPFSSGFGGYFFKPAIDEPKSYDKMYAICRRFWGIDAWNLDVTVQYVVDAYQSVNWLTLIGDALRRREPDAVELAKKRAWNAVESPHGVLLQACESAVLGDRNAGEPMPGYFEIADALLPLQATEFESFGGQRWTDENTMSWIRRFTHSSDVR